MTTLNIISCPGDTILDILQERQVTLELFAQMMGRSEDFCQGLLEGTTVIDEIVAYELSVVIGSTVNFWLTREANYRFGYFG